jgi:hypothetical protein
MTGPVPLLPPGAIPVTPASPVGLEANGIYPGSRLVASADEQALMDAEEAQAVAMGIKALHELLDPVSGCHCCQVGNAFGTADGLCDVCRAVVYRLRTEGP